MKLDIQPQEDHQVKITAEFDTEFFERYKRKAARKISEKGKIAGFRPGKAPYDVTVRSFGEQAIKEQAIEILIDDVYPDVLVESGIKPSGPGKLENIESIEPPKIVFLIPLEPVVTLGEYKSIRKDYHVESIKKADIEKVLKSLQSSYASTETVTRPAEKGDLVYIKLNGHLKKPKEGKKDHFVEDASLELIIGGSESDPDDWPFKGFSNQLIGLSKDETKVIPHTYPKEYSDDSLKGEKVEFSVLVEEVKEMHMPEIDDAFAQTVGSFDTAADLRTAVEKNLEATRKHEYDDEYFDDLIDQVVKQSTIKYPPHMVDEESDDILKSFKEDLSRRKSDLDTYLKVRQLELDKFIESEIRPAAIRRIERSLVLGEFAKAENVKVNQEQVRTETTQILENLLHSEEGKQVRGKKSLQSLTSAVMLDTANRFFNQATLKRLQEIATEQATESDEMDKTENLTKTTKKKTSGTVKNKTVEENIPQSTE